MVVHVCERKMEAERKLGAAATVWGGAGFP